MDPAEFHRRGCEEFDKRIQKVGDDQWSNSTPCSEWDVRALVNHLVMENRWVVPLLEGKTVPEVGDALDGDLLGSDPKAAWTESVREAQDAIARLGGKDDLVHVSWGDIGREDYIRQVAADMTLHSWDLARGIGTDEKLDDELVAESDAVVRPMAEMARQFGVDAYGKEPASTPEGADPQASLLAAIGRDV